MCGRSQADPRNEEWPQWEKGAHLGELHARHDHAGHHLARVVDNLVLGGVHVQRRHATVRLHHADRRQALDACSAPQWRRHRLAPCHSAGSGSPWPPQDGGRQRQGQEAECVVPQRFLHQTARPHRTVGGSGGRRWSASEAWRGGWGEGGVCTHWWRRRVRRGRRRSPPPWPPPRWGPCTTAPKEHQRRTQWHTMGGTAEARLRRRQNADAVSRPMASAGAHNAHACAESSTACSHLQAVVERDERPVGHHARHVPARSAPPPHARGTGAHSYRTPPRTPHATRGRRLAVQALECLLTAERLGG